jgi:putative endonuclease
MKQPVVDILANQPSCTLYIGVTSNLSKRIYDENKSHAIEGFTDKYDIGLLVSYEVHETMESAIVREKVLKRWNRAWESRAD